MGQSRPANHALRSLQRRYSIRSLDDGAMIELWDKGETRHPVDRALVMLDAACSALSWEQLIDLPLGQRDALLLAMRGICFGPSVSLSARCPSCDRPSEFTQDLAELLDCDPGEDRVQGTTIVSGDGVVSVRAPTSRDLAALYDDLGGEMPPADTLHDGCNVLLRRCLSPAVEPDAPLLRSVNKAIEEIDPMSVLLFPLSCPYCQHQWAPVLDVPGMVWAEVVNAAKRALHDVKALAGSYGWSEREILSMSRARRRYYLGQGAT